MKLIRVTATTGTTSPITIDEAKEYLRITSEQEIATVKLHLDAATEWCERSISGHMQLAKCTYQMVSSGFPDDDQRWELPMPPLNSSSSIKINYYNSTNGASTLASTLYDVVAPTDAPGFVKIKTGETWPVSYERPDAVTVQFTAGFGPPRKVPPLMKAAILLKTEHLYDPTRFDSRADVDQTVMNLLGRYDYGHYG